MAKFQQTRPKKQGRNNRGRRKHEPVTVAAKPFDWRTFKPKDYVADGPYGVSPLMAQLPAAREANRKRAKELQDNESNPRKG